MTAIAYVRDDQPGIRRLGTKRFRYVDARGRPVGAKTVARINALAIPPAWTDVWICPDPAGHIQATGRDARGRKQYRYHHGFRARRERAKFRDLIPFGEALGDVRRRVDADLRHAGLTRERVLAAVVSLMEQTFIRVGNESYARTNKTFGLTTLRCRHVDVTGTSLHLHFTAKGGKDVDVACCDPRLARVARRCQDLPGQLLFQYLDDDGQPSPVTSTDLNAYLRDITGLEATAKTFRTWGATSLAAQALVAADPGSSINELLRPVAATLGNTVAVCRSSYVHPTVVRLYEDGSLPELWEAGPNRAANGVTTAERRLLHMLRA